MVSTRTPTSKSSGPFDNTLVTVPKAPIMIGIIVTFMFHSFFNFLWRSRYLSFFSLFSVLFCGQLGQQSWQFCKFSFFFVDYYKVWSSSWDSMIHLYVSPIGVYEWHSLGQMLGCAYTICSYGQILIPCTSPSGSPCPPSRV